MIFIKKYAAVFAGVLIGGAVGYSYYYWIGCTSGSCPITSQPVNSTLYGSVMGGLMVTVFKKNK